MRAPHSITTKSDRVFAQPGPYATTIFDFIRRAMLWQAPKTLTDNGVYSVTAYILALNKIIGENDVINAENPSATYQHSTRLARTSRCSSS
jgi:cytochrome c